MLNIIHIDGKEIAVGLKWKALHGETSDKKEASEIARDAGLRTGIIFSAAGSSSSSLVGIYDGSAKRGLICGAAWLAQTAGQNADIVLIELVDDDNSWICAIRNGYPLEGYDLVVATKDIYDTLDGLQQLQDSSRSPYKIYSPGGFVEGSEDGDLTSLTMDSDGAPQGKPPTIQQLRGMSKNWILGSSAAGALLVTYILGSWYLNHQQAVDAARQSAANALAESASQNAAQAKAAASTRLRLEADLQLKVTGQPNYGAAIPAWLDAVGDVPVALAAWRLDTILCKGLTCEAEFRRQKLGTLDDIVAAAAEKHFTVARGANNSVTLSFPVNVTRRSLSPNSLPVAKEFLWHFTSQFQHMELAGLTFVVKNAEKSVITSDPVPGKPLEQVKSPWAIGEFTLSGTQFYEARDSIDYLKFDNIAADSLKIDFGHKSWTIGGNYATN